MRWKTGIVLTLAVAGATLLACNVRRGSQGNLESVETIHHNGKSMLWWSGDGENFIVKQCDERVTDQKIESFDQFAVACKGTAEVVRATRAKLAGMMIEIMNEDAGFDAMLKDVAKKQLIEGVRNDLYNNQWTADDSKTALDALEAQLKDLIENLEKARKNLAEQRATSNQAAGREQTDAELEAALGEAYAAAVKALKEMEEKEIKTKAGATAALKAYTDALAVVKADRAKFDPIAKEVLDRVADKDKVASYKYDEPNNFEISLLQAAALRLGMLIATTPQAMTCDDVCRNASPFADTSRCYSCRCKEAMGGSLPTTDEINCKIAPEVKIYKLKNGTAAGTFDLDAQATTPDSCFNPSLLYGDCQVGTKLGQLTKGQAHYKWICRHRSDPTSANATYGDVGVIAVNMTTGASCWWDDLGGEITDANFPKLDLTDATVPEIEHNKRIFYNTTGEGCTGCHDNDPFMFSPYFRSIDWNTEDYTNVKYQTTQLDGTLLPVTHRYLVSDEVANCTSCHRIASGSTCNSWAPQSMGQRKGGGIDDIVGEALDQKLEDGTYKEGKNWFLGYWMPPAKPWPKGTWQKWHDKNKEAKDMINKCCADFNANGCKWANYAGDPITSTEGGAGGGPTAPPEAPVAPAAEQPAEPPQE